MVATTRMQKSLTASARKKKSAKGLREIIRELKAENLALETENRQLKLENTQLTEAMLRMSDGEDRRNKRLKAQEEEILELKKMAHNDSLTGLLNRSGMEIALKQTIRMITREDGHGVLVYIDLDKFKLVNDICDHATGDVVLSAIGAILLERLRPTDLIARVGGDEFLVFLQDVDVFTAKKVIREIQERVWDISVDHASLGTLKKVAQRDTVIDFSAGYCFIEKDCESSFEVLMKEAEKDVPKFHARRGISEIE